MVLRQLHVVALLLLLCLLHASTCSAPAAAVGAEAEEAVWSLVFRQTTTEGEAVWQSMDDWRSYGRQVSASLAVCLPL